MTRLLVTIIAAMFAGSAAVYAAEPAKRLRTIVYDVVSSRHCSGAANTGDEHGTLTIAIVGKSANGSLLADLTFKGEAIDQAPFGIAIAPDGGLAYYPAVNPTTRLCPEVALLLPPLAVGFLTGQPIAVGQTRVVSSKTTRAYGKTWYHVDSIDGPRAVIAITDPGRRQPLRGKMTIATDVLSPVKLELESLHAYVRANLVSDSSQTAARTQP
jgi:hypothetical protein